MYVIRGGIKTRKLVMSTLRRVGIFGTALWISVQHNFTPNHSVDLFY